MAKRSKFVKPEDRHITRARVLGSKQVSPNFIRVTIGGEEGIYPDRPDRFAFGGLAEQVAALASDLPNVTFAVIPGANHSYTDRTDQLWTTVEPWLGQE